MGNFSFTEIQNFEHKLTAFTVHPKPISLSNLHPNEFQYLADLKMASEYVASKTPTTATGNGAVIGLLDTGVNQTHELLANKVIHAMNYAGSTKTEDTKDYHGHGTHLAGIICATKGSAEYYIKDSTNKQYATIRGVAPDAKIVSIKVTDEKDGYTAWWKIADGLEQVINYNAMIPEMEKGRRINIILIAYNALDNINRQQCTAHHRLQKLINFLWMQKIPVICSGGNGFRYFNNSNALAPLTGLAYPAYLKHVIVAVSKGKDNKLSDFTQRIFKDSQIKAKEQFAVYGEDTLSTGIKNDNDFTVLSGSSQAAAMLAGIYALQLENKGDILDSSEENFELLFLSTANEQTESIMTPSRTHVDKKYYSTSI